MAKTRRARIDAESDHQRVTRPRLRIMKAETQGFPTSYLRASSDTIKHGLESREVGYDEAKPLCGLWIRGLPPRIKDHNLAGEGGRLDTQH